MKVYWWQGGVYIEPELTEEREALFTLTKSLNLVDVDQNIPGSPTGVLKGNNKESVIGIGKLPEMGD